MDHTVFTVASVTQYGYERFGVVYSAEGLWLTWAVGFRLVEGGFWAVCADGIRHDWPHAETLLARGYCVFVWMGC